MWEQTRAKELLPLWFLVGREREREREKGR